MIVATTANPERLAGCLVGFSTQVSINPPRYLVCISELNHTRRVVQTASAVAVHTLTPAQLPLARLFGTETGDKVDEFARCAWSPGPHGVPLLEQCAYRFVGTIDSRIDLGDHVGLLLAPIASRREPPDEPAPAAASLVGFQSVRDWEAGHPA